VTAAGFISGSFFFGNTLTAQVFHLVNFCQRVYDAHMTEGISLPAWPPGHLGQPIATIKRPEMLRLDGESLVWSDRDELTRVETTRLLDRFIKLGDAVEILKFAQEFGPLHLCGRHPQIVAGHRPLGMIASMIGGLSPVPGFAEMDEAELKAAFCASKFHANTFEGDWGYSRPRPRTVLKPIEYSEPLADWRRLAAQAQALLEIADRIHRTRRKIDAATWNRLEDGIDLDDASLPGAYISNPRNRIAENLNRWILIADVTLYVRAQGPSYPARLGPSRATGSVLALIALELVAFVTRAGGMAECSGCHQWFLLLPNQPTIGKPIGDRVTKDGTPVRVTRNYCEECRRQKRPGRDAAREYRERQRRQHRKPARKSK
jgi:hypothetical protein